MNGIASGGFTCGTCGTWIPYGDTHTCTEREDGTVNLDAIPEHIREWATKELAPILEDVAARTLSVENWAKAHSAQADAVLNAVEVLAKVVDPAAAPEVAAAVTAAKAAAAEAQRLLDNVVAKM